MTDYDNIAYLNFIQGTISRMSANSALMKGFAATFMSVMLGMCVTETVNLCYLILAFVPVLSFIYFDVYYLQMEKRYRNLYALVADLNNRAFNYTLDLNSELLDDYKTRIYKDSKFWKVLWSISVWRFYILFIVAFSIIIILIA